MELAIQAVGAHHERAQRALEEVDTLRLRHFAQLSGAMEISEYDARIKSVMAYSCLRVAPSLPDYDVETSLVAVLDLLVP